ncbi:MAG TPA: hypothetical protein PKJ95_00205 [Atribacterota bacterium]|nr:hypothetical protein [Atribacterota bacterium]
MQKILRGVGTFRAKIPFGTSELWVPFITAKEINLGISAEDARQTGGDRYFPLDIMTTSKTGTVRVTDAALHLDIFKLLGTGDPGSTENFQVKEILTVSAGGVITTGASYVVGTVSLMDQYENFVSSGYVATDGATITGLSSYATTKMAVIYETADVSDAVVYSIHVNDLPTYFECVHVSRYRDPADNSIKLFQTRIYSCRPKGNLEYSYRHGEFSAPSFEAEVLDPGRVDGAVLTYAFGTEPAGLTTS